MMIRRQRRRAVTAVEHHEDHGQRHGGQQGDQPRRFLLRLELAFQRGEVTLRQWPRGQLGADVGDHPGHVTAIGVGREHDASP
jgi:hypothetical protein